MNVERLVRVRDTLPQRLNAGILLGDGGFCVLGWMMVCAGYHEITLYSSSIAILHPQLGGSAIDVVAREYGLDRERVVHLARLNDETPTEQRTDVVRGALDDLIASA